MPSGDDGRLLHSKEEVVQTSHTTRRVEGSVSHHQDEVINSSSYRQKVPTLEAPLPTRIQECRAAITPTQGHNSEGVTMANK